MGRHLSEMQAGKPALRFAAQRIVDDLLQSFIRNLRAVEERQHRFQTWCCIIQHAVFLPPHTARHLIFMSITSTDLRMLQIATRIGASILRIICREYSSYSYLNQLLHSGTEIDFLLARRLAERKECPNETVEEKVRGTCLCGRVCRGRGMEDCHGARLAVRASFQETVGQGRAKNEA